LTCWGVLMGENIGRYKQSFAAGQTNHLLDASWVLLQAWPSIPATTSHWRFHTASKPVSKHHLMRHTVEIGLDRWQSLDHETWTLIVGSLKGRARDQRREARGHTSAPQSLQQRLIILAIKQRGGD
jgi:hypothetical protein